MNFLSTLIKKKFIALFMFIFIYVFTMADNKQEIDSLSQLINTASNIDKYDIFNELFDHTINNNPDTALYYAEKMQILSQINNNKSQEAGSLINISLYYLYTNYYSEAEVNLDNALKIYEELEDTSNIALTYSILGGTYAELGNQAKSYKAFQKALNIHEEDENISGIINTNMNIGLMFMDYGDFEKSLEYYKLSWELAKKDNDLFDDGGLLNSLGIAYAELEINDSAYYFYKQSIQSHNKKHNLMGVCNCYVNLGNLFLDNFQYSDSATYYYNKALEIAKQTNSQKVISTIHLNMGELYLTNKDTTKALEQYKEALKIAMDIHNPKQEEAILQSIYILYKEIGDYKSSLLYFEEYNLIHDSLSGEKTEIAIANLAAYHEIENKKHEIIDINSKRQFEQIIFTIIIIAFIITIIILALFIKFHIGLKKTEKYKFLLEKQLIKADNETETLKQRELKSSIEYKSRQLTSHALNMMQKNQLLFNISTLLTELRKGVTDEYSGTLRDLTNTINQGINADKDWDVFKIYYDDTNKGFFDKLKKVAPNLSVNEQRLCVLVMLKLNVKETASVLNLSPNSIKSARYKLRKKFNLETQDDLFEFLDGI